MTLVRHACILAFLLLVASLVPITPAAPVSAGGPATFYVATTGKHDNPGTLDSPWRTIQHAASTVPAGSIVYVRGGVYNETITITVSGSPEAGATRFESFPGETAIVDGTGLEVPDRPSALFLIVDRSYLVVRGFELRNYASAGRDIVPAGVLILGASHHVEVSANHIHDIETQFPGAEGGDAHGIAVYGTSANESAHDILIAGNELHDLKLGSSESIAINGNVERFTVADNVVHDVNNIAIDCIGYEGTCPDPTVDQARDGFVINNTVFNVDSFGNPAYGEDRSAGGIYVDGGRDILVERNTVHHANIGIELASEHRGRATSGVTVRSNLVYRNDVTGISIGGYDKRRGTTENCAIVNNTVVDNDTLETGTGEINLQFGTRDNTIRNNIVVAGAQGKLIGNEFKKNRGNVVDSNLYTITASASVRVRAVLPPATPGVRAILPPNTTMTIYDSAIMFAELELNNDCVINFAPSLASVEITVVKFTLHGRSTIDFTPAVPFPQKPATPPGKPQAAYNPGPVTREAGAPGTVGGAWKAGVGLRLSVQALVATDGSCWSKTDGTPGWTGGDGGKRGKGSGPNTSGFKCYDGGNGGAGGAGLNGGRGGHTAKVSLKVGPNTTSPKHAAGTAPSPRPPAADINGSIAIQGAPGRGGPGGAGGPRGDGSEGRDCSFPATDANPGHPGGPGPWAPAGTNGALVP